MPTKFDFLSPGVQLREIDQSQVPETPENPGILLIGRARSGPAMKPIKVTNLNDFVDTFGLPMDGVRQADPWRQGNTGAPNYAAYAAQAYLAAGVGPVQYVRLLGKSKDGVTTGNNAPGWNMGSTFGSTENTAGSLDIGTTRISSSAAAYGLFIVPSGSTETGQIAATLENAITCDGAVTNGAELTVDVPVAAGGRGSILVTFIDDSTHGTTAPTDEIYINRDTTGAISAAATKTLLEKALAGEADADIAYGTGLPDGDGSWNKVATYGLGSGLTVSNGTTSTTQITLTCTAKGAAGNLITVTDGVVAGLTVLSPLAGGEDTLAAVTGTLAAVFYASGSAFGISGSWVSGSAVIGAAPTSLSASTLMKGNGASYGVNLGLSGAADSKEYFSVNFTDETNASYIRNVLNTDPTKFYNDTNYGETDLQYFLGETFDVNVDRLSGNGGKDDTFYFIAGLGDTGFANYDNFRQELTAAKSGWFIGARPEQKYLFRLVALQDGEEFQNNYYCRVANIKLATALQPRASFTLQIVKRGGTVLNDTTVEEFTNLTLDPDSENYIVKRIGDLDQNWSSSEGKYTLTGLYPNISNYVRVVMAENAGVVGSDCPVGFLGPVAPAAVEVTSDTAESHVSGSGAGWFHASSSIALGNSSGSFIAGWPAAKPGGAHPHLTASIQWPTFGMTTFNTKISSQNYPATSYFGLRHVKSTSLVHDKSFQDIARRRSAIDPDLAEGAAITGASFVFTLEDIRSASLGSNEFYWDSGSYNKTGDSMSVAGVGGNVSTAVDAKIKQFAAPFFGGADGVDVRYADPFANNQITNNAGGATGYPHYSVEQAIEMVADPEQVEYELISAPGLLKGALVDKLVNQTTERGDALAIIDLVGIEQPKTDNGGTKQPAKQSTLINTLNTQFIDSSYAATYFPNVRLKDTLNGNGTILAAPPSVAGIGAIAQSEEASQPWFAPAGFNRGGLGRLGGTAGPQVVGTVLHLTKDNRDVLYESQINPIARFPATGDTVIFGQKTLQQTASALDRINVRRLMIYLKRHIGNIADTILFDQNVQATWLRFKSRADAVLAQVKSDLGIVEYKLVLDETTTTADLIDRNIMYAKVFVKPARSIEFIAVDFIITRSGVEF